jgi:large subunit ribosomal protein L6
MSRIGKLLIKLPTGVTAKLAGRVVQVTGPKGTLTIKLHEKADIKIDDQTIRVVVDDENFGNIHGMTRSLIFNMVKGVTEGWSKILELNGTGYRAGTSGPELSLALGFSHPINIKAPSGINFEVKENKITIKGADKEMVGEIAAKIRGLKPADPYKLKGFKYEGEVIIKKVGKAVKAATA